MGSGATALSFQIISPTIARIEGSADFDYFSPFSPDFFQNLGQTPDYGAGSKPDFGVYGKLRAAHLSVESRQRFVQKQEAWLGDDRARHGNALHFAARHGFDRLTGSRETDASKKRQGARLHLGRGGTGKAGGQQHVVGGG